MLVAVIAFAIILSISAGGLLMLAGNSVGTETAELDDYKTFHVAEAGLQLGLRWLAVPAIWSAVQTSDTSRSEIVSGMLTTVSTIHDVNGRLVLSSRVDNNRLMYIKEITCNVDSSNGYGLVVNSVDPVWPLLDNIWFDGPVRSNAPLQMAYASLPGAKRGSVYFVNGPVIVRDTRTGLPSRCIGPSGNDYGYGIYIGGSIPDPTQGRILDRYFDNTFAYTRDSVVVPDTITRVADYTLLQVFSTPRPILYFDTTAAGIGRARYFRTGANSPDTIPDVNGMIIQASNPIDVLGIVKGKVTVVTTEGHNIYPVGDLVYADFMKLNPAETGPGNYDTYNPITNYGINPSSPNYLALISGGDIHFCSGNEKRFNTANPGVLADTTYPGGTNIWVTAALFAIRSGRGIRWDTISGSPNIQLSAFNYNIYVIGSRTVDQFFNYPSRSNNPALANTQFRFYYDRRFDNNLAAPGVPAFRRITPGGNNLYLLKTTNWREKNLPRP